MNFTQSIKTCFKKYVVFKGRATRSEFWWFQLFFWVVGLGVFSLEGLLGYDFSGDGLDAGLVFELVLFIPVLSATARRLHDVGLTGWLQTPVLLSYVSDVGFYFPGFNDLPFVKYLSVAAIISVIILYVICARRGQDRGNRYGPNPKSPEMGEVFS